MALERGSFRHKHVTKLNIPSPDLTQHMSWSNDFVETTGRDFSGQWFQMIVRGRWGDR